MRASHPLCALAVLLALVGSTAGAQEEPPMTDEMRAEMSAWMEAASPGEPHLELARYAGVWTGAVSLWMDPDQPPMQETGRMEAKMIMGDRFLQSRWGGNFGGMPFEGMSLDGYNNLTGEYESVWIDNFGTLMIHYAGGMGEDGVRTMSGSFADAMSGGTYDQQVTYSWVDDDHWTYTSWVDNGERRFKNLEIHYERTE